MKNKPYKLALHIFRRDLRLQDNSALIAALGSAHTVIPCFIFDKRQIENNHYKSNHCIQFMITSLLELDAQLREKNSKLYFFYGIAEEVVEQLILKLPIDAVFVNRDYTPFSIERDRHIEKVCRQQGVTFQSYSDALLHEPEQVQKANGKPYTVFSAYFNCASQLPVTKPHKNTGLNYYQQAIALANDEIIKKLSRINDNRLFVKGGRSEALTLLKKVKQMQDYKNTRDYPALQSTSKLSAHNKFGTISIREFYSVIVNYLGSAHTLIKELYWRDFFTHIAFHFPYVFGEAFQQKYNSISWSNDKRLFSAWYEGHTGFPIVDAGMRELNATGYMHNRVRMIVASFLVKDLHIDWRWGERYFAQQLIDYDPAVNNGNWQWAASTGCDATPYFRIFNPWLQQQKFDHECHYIKHWIPELTALAPKIIHKFEQNPPLRAINYPKTVVNHAINSNRAKELYRNTHTT